MGFSANVGRHEELDELCRSCTGENCGWCEIKATGYIQLTEVTK